MCHTLARVHDHPRERGIAEAERLHILGNAFLEIPARQALGFLFHALHRRFDQLRLAHLLNFCKRILFSGMFFLLLPLPFRFPFGFCFLVPTAPFCFRCRRIFLLCFRFSNRLRRRLLARHFRSGGSFFLLVLLDQLCLQGLHFCRFGIVSVQFCLLVFQIKF